VSDDETFLTRWARRKRDAAKTATTVAPPPDANAVPSPGDADVPVETTGIAPRVLPPDSDRTPSPAIFDPAQLPSLDSISAATDIRAFLAPGVPADLTRAALRRAWSADPAIRDFVGLADYDWDFNTPGAITGFQPFEMTEELHQRISDMVGRNLAVPETDRLADEVDDSAAADTPEVSSNTNAASIDASMSAHATMRLQPEAAPNEIADSSREREESGISVLKYTAVQHTAVQHPAPDTVEQTEALQRRHGRALPK
jgi:hypothetical protein